MYTHVLVPVQLDSEKKVEDARAAAQMLAADGARITFLHVVEPVPAMVEAYMPIGQDFPDREGTRAQMEDIARAVPGAQAALADGAAGRAIVQWAEDHSADCIVIASHQPELSDVILGSTASWVVRHARCAVHVLR